MIYLIRNVVYYSFGDLYDLAFTGLSMSVFTARICSRVKIFIILVVITLTVTAGGIEFIKTFVLRPTEPGIRK